MLYIAGPNTDLRLAIAILCTGEQMTDPANLKLQRAIDEDRAHPGVEFMARAVEAAENQDRFWEMYDVLFDEEPPFAAIDARELARKLVRPAVAARTDANVLLREPR